MLVYAADVAFKWARVFERAATMINHLYDSNGQRHDRPVVGRLPLNGRPSIARTMSDS